jgi:hypothetical protein
VISDDDDDEEDPKPKNPMMKKLRSFEEVK